MEADFKEKIIQKSIDEHFKEKGYDDISYRRGSIIQKNDYTYEQYVSSEITLTEHLMSQLSLQLIKHSCRNIGRYTLSPLMKWLYDLDQRKLQKN